MKERLSSYREEKQKMDWVTIIMLLKQENRRWRDADWWKSTQLVKACYRIFPPLLTNTFGDGEECHASVYYQFVHEFPFVLHFLCRRHYFDCPRCHGLRHLHSRRHSLKTMTLKWSFMVLVKRAKRFAAGLDCRFSSCRYSQSHATQVRSEFEMRKAYSLFKGD